MNFEGSPKRAALLYPPLCGSGHGGGQCWARSATEQRALDRREEMAMAELEGKRALVTGGAQGLGRAIATLFVERGAKVMIADIDEAGAKVTADELGESVRAVACDVTSASDLEAAVQATVDGLGGLDIIVNNGG